MAVDWIKVLRPRKLGFREDRCQINIGDTLVSCELEQVRRAILSGRAVGERRDGHHQAALPAGAGPVEGRQELSCQHLLSILRGICIHRLVGLLDQPSEVTAGHSVFDEAEEVGPAEDCVIARYAACQVLYCALPRLGCVVLDERAVFERVKTANHVVPEVRHLTEGKHNEIWGILVALCLEKGKLVGSAGAADTTV